MAYDVGLRQALNGKGVDNNRIGYNVNTGTVTVDGRDFLRPQKNFSGTTFTDQGSFNNAWQNFGNNQAMPQPGQNVQQPTTAYQNPYDTKVSDTLAGLMDRINNPQKIDPYSTPEYAAAQAQQGRNAQQGIRTAQESLGASGFARSTNLADRAQNIQNGANEYLMTQVVPQIAAQKRAEEQQGLANLMSLLGAFSNQQGVYDNRDQRGFERGIQEGTLTGNYLNADAKSLLQHVLDLKATAEDPNTTEAGRIEAGKQADAYRALLPQYGIDPNIVGSGVNLATARQNVMGAGKTTLAKQGQEFSQGVQMSTLTGFLPNGKPTNAYEQQQLTNAWKTIDAIGHVPPELAAIVGVPAGTETLQAKQIAIAQQNANTAQNRPTSTGGSATADKNSLMSEVVGQIDTALSSDPSGNSVKSFLNGERANLIAELGMPGYNQLRDMYLDKDGEIKK